MDEQALIAMYSDVHYWYDLVYTLDYENGRLRVCVRQWSTIPFDMVPWTYLPSNWQTAEIQT